MRSSTRLFLPRGRFSSMLDMGGMSPSGSETAKRIDIGTNNRVRAIALDFDLITRSIEASKATAPPKEVPKGENTTSGKIKIETDIKPNVNVVESIADALGVKLGDEDGHINLGRKRVAAREEEDDLSALTGLAKDAENDSIQESILSSLNTTTSDATTTQPQQPKRNAQKAPPTTDIRTKYASALRKKLESTGSSLSTIERVKIESRDFTKKGDASDHLAARAAAIHAGSPSSSPTKWMASTGTGTLLSYLTSRSMIVALLPPLKRLVPPSSSSSSWFSFSEKKEIEKIEDETLQTQMNLLSTQLPNAEIELQLSCTNLTPPSLLQLISTETSIVPGATLVVSDRDDYLRVAKDMGMYTCRVRFSKNAPRGNVSANFDVVDVVEVMEVVNEINGVSFNSVLSGFGKK
uniref:Uncharacterized protein n=1 Tax=Ditylum brightwellii TaxID=49249 RepID=A0A7S4RDT5_9STRA